jgi:signal peptidase I
MRTPLKNRLEPQASCRVYAGLAPAPAPNAAVGPGGGLPPPADDERGGAGEEQYAADGSGEMKTRARAGRRRSGPGFILEAVILILIAVLLAVLIQSFLIKAFVIPSSSMSPTLQVGDRVMVERLTYLFREPRRGEIVVFRFPPDTPEAMNTSSRLYWPLEQIGETLRLTHRGVIPYVKRVVATGGETVELRSGKLFIDGQEIQESYIIDDGSDYGPVTVPEGMLFCMGDNRPNSRDSRFWGMVPTRSVIGRGFLIWWPVSRWRTPR